jgi:hypothetical protein
MPTVKDVIKSLLDQYSLDDVVAVSIWTREDVLSRAKEIRYRLTKDQVDEVLEEVNRKHDASQGINWDVLGCHIENVGTPYGKRKNVNLPLKQKVFPFLLMAKIQEALRLLRVGANQH